MKVLFFILVTFVLSNCINQTAALKSENASTKPTPPIDNTNNANANNWMPMPEEALKIDEARRKELEIQNEKFRQTPDEFKNVDFKNFKYPVVRLKNGEYDDFDPNKPLRGKQTFSLSDVFYADLDSDTKKEADVMLYAVGCGASCDGGRDIIYFYSFQKGKPKLIDEIEMGSRSGACSLKSLIIKDKKIIIEQFGRCAKNSNYQGNRVYSCKFCVKDLTQTVYSIKHTKIVKESSEIFETPEINVMNYSSEISINE